MLGKQQLQQQQIKLRSDKNYYYLSLLLLLSSVIIITIITWWESQRRRIMGEKLTLTNLIPPPKYDGYELTRNAIINLSVRNSTTPTVNCNTNMIECETDKQCSQYCMGITGYSKALCRNGLCKYKSALSGETCRNGGTLASFFNYGRNYTTCMCPKEFLGDYCEIPNQMVPISSDKFVL